MSIMHVDFEEWGATPGLIKRHKRKIFKDALTRMATYWLSRHMPRHFTERGARLYGYKQRTPAYMRVKSRPHRRDGRMWPATRDPLVFTGRTRDDALRAAQSPDQYARGTSTRIRAVIPAPGLNLRRWPSSPNMRDEVVRKTADERQVLRNQAKAEVLRGVKRYAKARIKKRVS